MDESSDSDSDAPIDLKTVPVNREDIKTKAQRNKALAKRELAKIYEEERIQAKEDKAFEKLDSIIKHQDDAKKHA